MTSDITVILTSFYVSSLPDVALCRRTAYCVHMKRASYYAEAFQRISLTTKHHYISRVTAQVAGAKEHEGLPSRNRLRRVATRSPRGAQKDG